MPDWSLERLKGADIALKTCVYQVVPITAQDKSIKGFYPGIFEFEAISIGDDDGQAFIVPLDESGRGTAELILKALVAYTGE